MGELVVFYAVRKPKLTTVKCAEFDAWMVRYVPCWAGINERSNEGRVRDSVQYAQGLVGEASISFGLL